MLLLIFGRVSALCRDTKREGRLKEKESLKKGCILRPEKEGRGIRQTDEDVPKGRMLVSSTPGRRPEVVRGKVRE